MKKSLIALLLSVLAIALVAPTNVHAANNTPTPKPKKSHTVIQSVDASSITVKEPDATVTYKITADTEITYKGNTVTAADLKPGMRVSVSAGSDAGVAERISAEDPPKDQKNQK